MKKLKMRSKKAVSELISYVLLIVIAISLSLIVYAFIKVQLPKEKAECPEGASIIIKEIKCNGAGKALNLTLQNKGFFDIDGMNIKIADKPGQEPVDTITKVTGPNIYTELERDGFVYFRTALSPGLESKINFSYSDYNNIARIQITPFIKSSKVGERRERIVLCNNKKIAQDISCS